MPHLGFIFHNIYLIFNILGPNQLNPFNFGPPLFLSFFFFFFFLCLIIKLVSKLWCVTENVPKLKENETDRRVVVAVEAWKHADFLCKNYILNGLDNTLYNAYSSIKTAKEL